MPELPEVETVVNDLRPALAGLTFQNISGEWEKMVNPAFAAFKKIKNQKVLNVARRGKFIVILMENGKVITLHLRMSGRILVRKSEDCALPYERVRLDFDKASLRFCDIRKFGKIWLSDIENYESLSGIDKLGPEPLAENFGVESFAEAIEGQKGAIKRVLLDQTVIAGIGNIYADESLFYAGILPDREVSGLSVVEIEKLFEGIVAALKQGIRNRGTSISDYADAYGKTGRNQELLKVYGRGGEKCMHCENILTKVKLVGRGTVFCSNCQK